MLKRMLVLLLALVMVAGMVPCASAEEEFRIGISVSFTGPNAQNGLEAINGLKMALEEINAAGGFNGEQGVLATLYDSKGSTEEAVKTAMKLTQNEDVDAVIASQVSAEVLAAGQYYEDAQIFTIGMGTSASWMKKGWKYLIRGSVNYDFVAPEVVSMIFDMGINQIAVMKDQSEAALSFAATFTKLCEEKGIEILLEESCEPDDTDLSAQCARIVGAKPQAIFLSMTSNDCGYFVKQVRQSGYTGLIFDKESFFASMVNIAGPENSNYILFANPYVTYADLEDCTIENMKAFLTKYLELYGALPTTEIAYRAYDSAMVIWEATKISGSNETEAMLAAVPQIKIEGLGGTMDYTNGDGEPYHAVRRFIYLDGLNQDWGAWMESGGYEAYKAETGNAY
ncbi:MAG: ABC transporter substrate-binding protein [Clostridiales bacterium]|nr:ABC transporter substrate-binding protein [Clostridiales bacterium]